MEEPRPKYYSESNRKSIKKYFQTDHGKAKLREAKQRYYLKKKAEKEAQQQAESEMYHDYFVNAPEKGDE